MENKRGRREKKKKSVTSKSLFLFLLFYNYSFASAIQRRIEKLKLRSHNILNHSKWRRIEKDLPKCSVMGFSTLDILTRYFTLPNSFR
jgi:hypothetical protein